VSTSPLDPQDIRAAAEVYRELGPEYSDEVVAAFIDRVDRAVAARVEARLADARLDQERRQPARRSGRRTLFRGVALGLCAGAVVAAVGVSHVHPVLDHIHYIPQGQLRPVPRVPQPPAAP
jgi:hypothetical protein